MSVVKLEWKKKERVVGQGADKVEKDFLPDNSLQAASAMSPSGVYPVGTQL